MDPLLSGIGPYSFGGTTATGIGAIPTMIGNNDMLMMPFLQSYQAQLDGMDAMAQNGVVANGATNPGVGTIDTSKMYEQMQKMQEQMMDYNLQMQERNRKNQFAVNTPYVNIDNAIMVLHEKIVQNEQDQILSSVEVLKNAVREAYDPEGKMDDATLTAQANNIYMQKVGCTMQDDIRANGHNSFTGGFLNTFCFGFFGDKVSPEENIARINGQTESETSQKWRKVGKIAGSTAQYAAIGAGIGSIIPGIGTAAGAGIGAVVGFIGGLFS